MNLPNILTISRIFLTFIFVAVLLRDGIEAKIIAAVIFAIASLTDLLDGYFAKKRKQVTDFGKLMDPIADKFLTLAAFFVFARMNVIAFWMFALVAGREIVVTIFRLVAKKRKGAALAAERGGKYKTVFQIVTIGVILLFLILRESEWAANWPSSLFYQWYTAIDILMLITIILTLTSGSLYLWKNRRVIHAPSFS